VVSGAAGPQRSDGAVRLLDDESGFACDVCRLLYPIDDGILWRRRKTASGKHARGRWWPQSSFGNPMYPVTTSTSNFRGSSKRSRSPKSCARSRFRRPSLLRSER
jgi:hypothetical protein